MTEPIPRGLDWRAIRGGWRKLIEDIAMQDRTFRTDASEAERRQRRTNAQTDDRITLKYTGCAEIGEDEWRRTFDATNQAQITTIVGMRRITLQVKVETEREEDDFFPFVTLEKIRTRIWLPENIERCATFDSALIETTDIRDASYDGDDHRVPCAIFDIRFSASFEDQQPPDPAGWIEFVELTSHVQVVPGNELPANEQLNKVLIPPGLS